MGNKKFLFFYFHLKSVIEKKNFKFLKNHFDIFLKTIQG